MKLGFIGTGLMGAPMVLRLLEGGFEVGVYNRTRAKLEPLERAGAWAAPSVAELVRQSDCVILMVTNAEAIASLLFLPDVESHLGDRTLVQMSTIAPMESQSLCDRVNAAGGHYLEAPVLGSIPQAQEGSLLVMVGSTPELFERCLPVLRCMGENPVRLGDVGTASTAKLALNQLIGSLTTAFALSLTLVQRSGVEVEQFMDILRQSALYAPTFDKKLTRMLEHDFSNPNFPTKHLLKDMKLFTDTAQSLGLPTEVTESVSNLIQQAIDQGLADEDYSALMAAIDRKG